MDTSLRAHRGGTVIALGALSLLPLILCLTIPSLAAQIPSGIATLIVSYASPVLGIAALWLGWIEHVGMKWSRVDQHGRPMVRTGQILGALGTVTWLVYAIVLHVELRSMGLVDFLRNAPSQ